MRIGRHLERLYRLGLGRLLRLQTLGCTGRDALVVRGIFLVLLAHEVMEKVEHCLPTDVVSGGRCGAAGLLELLSRSRRQVLFFSQSALILPFTAKSRKKNPHKHFVTHKLLCRRHLLIMSGPALDPLSAAAKTPPSASSGGTAHDFPHVSSTSSAAAARPSIPWQSLSPGDGHVTLMIVGPDGSKSPLRIRLTDDVATLRALVTQMYGCCLPLLLCCLAVDFMFGKYLPSEDKNVQRCVDNTTRFPASGSACCAVLLLLCCSSTLAMPACIVLPSQHLDALWEARRSYIHTYTYINTRIHAHLCTRTNNHTHLNKVSLAGMIPPTGPRRQTGGKIAKTIQIGLMKTRASRR